MAPTPLFDRVRLARTAKTITPSTSGRAFALYAIATFLLQAGGVIAFGVVVNPRSEFPTHVIEPLVENERHAKTLHYATRSEAPQAVILGSSRAWGLPPDALEELGFAPAYNFAVGGATTEDARRTFDFMLAHGEAPREIVYAFEDWQLDATHDVPWTQSAPLTSAELVRYAKLALGALSFDYLRDSWRALKAHATDVERTWRLHPNGTASWERFETAKLAGTWDVGDASAHFLGSARAHYGPSAKADPQREATLAALVADALDQGTTVILFLTPMHPEATRLFPAPAYERSVAHARTVLIDQCQPGVRVYDLTDPSSYGSNGSGFVDGWHFGAGEGRQILEHLHRAPDLCSQEATS